MSVITYKVKHFFPPKKIAKSTINKLYSISNLKDVINSDGMITDAEELSKDWVAVGEYIEKATDKIKSEVDNIDERENT